MEYAPGGPVFKPGLEGWIEILVNAWPVTLVLLVIVGLLLWLVVRLIKKLWSR